MLDDVSKKCLRTHLVVDIAILIVRADSQVFTVRRLEVLVAGFADGPVDLLQTASLRRV